MVDLFAPEEHLVLSAWFRGRANLRELARALDRLGVAEERYAAERRPDAAVAFILLESVEGGLPNCGIGSDGEMVLTRQYRSLVRARRVAIVPRHLFTLNWADTGPGVCWPGAYYVTWVPVYDRYVVTYSADTPEVLGYCDVALGRFGLREEIKAGSRRIITRDWRQQREDCQERWAYLFSSGIVTDAEAECWADRVWGKRS